jgi:AcrR family transcriptional regulator
MTMTPWGHSERLREVARGRGAEGPAKGIDQRRRIQGAMVAACAEHGYRAVTIAHLTEIAGVSRRDFYAHFPGKKECFIATVEEAFALATAAVSGSFDAAPDPLRGARDAAESFAEQICEQPAAARMCLLESYAAGPQAREAVERGAAGMEAVIAEIFARAGGARPMPASLIRAFVGAAYKVTHTRLHEGREEELRELCPRLLGWALSYEAPTRPLRPRRPETHLEAPGIADSDPLLAAITELVCERGFDEATGARIVKAAHISYRTLYARFENREDAVMAAIEAGGERMLAATLPLVEAAPDWPGAVRTAFLSTCSMMAADPAMARLRALEVYAIGPEAVALRDGAGERLLGALNRPHRPDAPAAEPLILEAIVGGIYALAYDQAAGNGPADPTELVPVLTYLALPPFLGAEEATRRANGP